MFSLFWGSYFFDFQIFGFLRSGCVILGMYWLIMEIKQLIMKIITTDETNDEIKEKDDITLG